MLKRDYSEGDFVTNLHGIANHVNLLLRDFGYKQFTVKINKNEQHRMWIGGIIVELQTPDDFSRGYFNDNLKREYSQIPNGYSSRSDKLEKRSKAFIPYGSFERVLSTFGHEVFGHLLSPALPVQIDDEAKAYSFQGEWNLRMQNLGIGNISTSYKNFTKENPCNEYWPVHFRAHAFVIKMMEKGANPLSLFEDFSRRRIWIPD